MGGRETDTLVGWKQISEYLGICPRTAVRWNRQHRLPVCTNPEFGVAWTRVSWIREWQDKHKPFQRHAEEDQQKSTPSCKSCP